MTESEGAIQSHARVVIIGGGIFGVSILYHLAEEGWRDVVLIEKGELSSGTTWHAAGQCPHFIGDVNMGRIHDYGSVENSRLVLQAVNFALNSWGDEVFLRIARATVIAHSNE